MLATTYEFYKLPSSVNFGADYRVNPVTLRPSGPGIAGNTLSLICSATLNAESLPLLSNVPYPAFEWFFGPDSNDSLPSGVTPTATISGYNFTSTLQFSPALNESHEGMYTCRLGAGRLANSTYVSVDGMLTKLNWPI